jgi:hypothetical protein
MISRRQFVKKLSTATALMSAGIPIITKAQVTKRPNIIFIMSDDHALDWLKTRSTTKPFCLMIQHKAPHADWIADVKHAGMYSDHDPKELQNLYYNDDNVPMINDLRTRMNLLKKKYAFIDDA